MVAAIVAVTMPLMAHAKVSEQKPASKTTATAAEKVMSADKIEIEMLKRQLSACMQHKKQRKHRRHRAAPKRKTQVIEKIIEKPVYIEKIIEKPVYIEKIVEKEVFVERPAEKQVLVEQEMDSAVIIEHGKNRTHLLHFGIPWLGSIELF
jgi:hypothetical protein